MAPALVHRRLSTPYLQSVDLDAALDEGEARLSDTDSAVERAQVHVALANIRRARKEPSRATAHARAAVELLALGDASDDLDAPPTPIAPQPTVLLAQAEATLARALAEEGDLKLAIAHFRRACELYESQPDERANLYACRQGLADVEATAGEDDQGAGYRRLLSDLEEEVEHDARWALKAKTRALLALAEHHLTSGERESASESLEAAREYARRGFHPAEVELERVISRIATAWGALGAPERAETVADLMGPGIR